MDIITNENINTIANSFNSFIPITRTEEDEIISSSLKNNFNVYIDQPLGSLDWIDGNLNYRITQGPVDFTSLQQRSNFGALEKSQVWYGGIFGQSAQQLDRQWVNLYGEEAGPGKWIPFYSYYSNKIEEERRRVDDIFVANKDKEIDNALVTRFGQDNALAISKILEQDYGGDWKKTFAKGAKNSNAYLEQVNEVLQNRAMQTTQLGQIRESLNNITTPWSESAPRWIYQNLIADYDMVASTALTMGLDLWAAGGINGLKSLTIGAAKLPVYTALRFSNPVTRSSIAQLFPKMAAISERVGVLDAGGTGVWKSLMADLSLTTKPSTYVRKFLKTGDIPASAIEGIGMSNPFNPLTQARSWMKWNAANIVRNDGSIVAENALKNKALNILNQVGLTVDDFLFIGQTAGLGEQMFKMGRIGAILGSLDGFANSVWYQNAAHDKLLMQEDKDIPNFDLSLAIHDAAVFAGMGFVLGGAFGAVFSPVKSTLAGYSLIDGSSTLGSKTPRRGLKQLFGSNRVTQEQWKMQSDIVRLAGNNGLAAVQIGKTATVDQLRTVLKVLTGDSKRADFYLDPNWLAEHGISIHEVGDVVRHMLEVISKASPEYSVNPVSHELLSEIFLDLARAKRENPNLDSAQTVDLIRGQELQEKLERFGVLKTEPNKKPVRKYKTSQEVQNEINQLEQDVISGKVTQEEYNYRTKALKRLLEKKKTRESNQAEFARTQEEITNKEAQKNLLENEEVFEDENFIDLPDNEEAYFLRNKNKEKNKTETGIENVPTTVSVKVKDNKLGEVEWVLITTPGRSGFDVVEGQPMLVYELRQKGGDNKSPVLGRFTFIWDKQNKAFRPLALFGINIRNDYQRQNLYGQLLKKLSEFVDLGSTSTIEKEGTKVNAQKVWEKLNATKEKLKRVDATKEKLKRVEATKEKITKINSEIEVLQKKANKLKETLGINDDVQSSTVSVDINASGSIDRIKVSGHDISNTKAGFLLTKYLDTLKKLTEAGKISDKALRTEATVKLRKELGLIEAEMDASFKLREDGKTRAELRMEWANERWSKIESNPELKARFKEALSQALEAHRASAGDRFVSMNWWSELWNGTGFGKLFNAAATLGSGVTDQMYATVDLIYNVSRLVDDGHFFAYSDLANPYQTFSITEAIANGWRKAQTINETLVKLRRMFPDQAKEIEKRARLAILSGKTEIDPKGLTEDMIREGNSLISLNRDFYEYHANQAKQLGKSYTEPFTYIPQMTLRELAPDEVARLGQLGFEAMRRKIRETRIIPWSELERLGQIVRNPETGEILSIPENSLFYKVDAQGNPLPMDEMISSIPKTLEELKILEAKRRIESQSTAQLPNDLQEALNTPVGVKNLTDAEKTKVREALISKIDALLNRSQNRIYGDYDLVYASQHLLTLRNLAEELNSDELRTIYNKYVNELKEKRGIEINENPQEPKEIILNEKKNETDKLQNIFVFVPEVKRNGQVLHSGNVLKRWVPEGTEQVGKAPPAMTFSSRLQELAGNLKDSPFTKEAQHLGHAYTMETLIRRLANQFGENEPTSYPNVIPIESLQDSLITMEHMIEWTKDNRFASTVDAIFKSLDGKVNKSTIGMMVISDWVNIARNHNLSLLKNLPDSVLDKIHREFNLFNLTTLRSRLNGTKLDAVNLLELLNKKFFNLLDKNQSPEISSELRSHIFMSPQKYELWSPSKLFTPPEMKYEGRSIEGTPILDKNNVFGNIEAKNTKRLKIEAALQKNKSNYERLLTIQKLLKKATKEEKVALMAEFKQLKKKLKIEGKGFKPVLTKVEEIGKKLRRDLEELVGRKEVKVSRIEELSHLTDEELSRLLAFYNESINQKGVIAEPMLDFLFKNLNKEVTVANAFDRLDKLGIEPAHILEDGTLSLEGRVAYLKKLANSDEARAAEATQKKRVVSSTKQKTKDYDPILQEYYQKRSEIQQRLESARELHSDHVANVESHQEGLYQLQDLKQQLETQLNDGTSLIDSINSRIQQLNITENRSIAIQNRIKLFNEKIKELEETIPVLKDFASTYVKENEINSSIQGYNLVLENLIEQRNKAVKELEENTKLLEQQTEEIKSFRQQRTTEVPQTTKNSWIKDDIARLDEQIKVKENLIKELENQDPLVRAEEDLRRLEYEYEGVEGTTKDTTIPGLLPRRILWADQYRLEQLERVVGLLKKNLEKYNELKARSNIRTDENINIFEQNLYDSKEVPNESGGTTFEYTEPSIVEHNQTVAALTSRIRKFETEISRLRKVGNTARRNNYIEQLGNLQEDINGLTEQLKQLNADTRFTPVDNSLSNFEAVYNWMNDTWNTLNQYTTHAWSVVEAGKKAGQTLPINMNQAIRTAESMNEEVAIIREGLSVGLLFRGFEGTERTRRFTVVDLNDSTLEPKDLTPYKRGGVTVSDLDQAKILIRQRKTHNFENPSDSITIESLIDKKLKEFALVPETEKLNKNLVTLMKSLNNWVKGQEEWSTLIKKFDEDRLTIAATELMEDPAAQPLLQKLEKDLVASSFNIMNANKESTRKRFADVWVEFQGLKEQAKQTLELQIKDKIEAQQKILERFKERSKKPVPVFSQERADIIKGLLAEKEQALAELRKLGKAIDDPNKELGLIGDRIGELYDLFFKLSEGRIVSDADINGISIKHFSKNKKANLQQKTKSTPKDVVDDSALGLDGVTVKEIAGEKFNFTKLIKVLDTIKNKDGELPYRKIKGSNGNIIYITNENFNLGDVFRTLYYGDTKQQNALYKFIALQARKQAENDLRRAGITNISRVERNNQGDITKIFAVLTEDDIRETIDNYIGMFLAHNNAINSPDISLAAKTIKEEIISLKKENPDWRFDSELRSRLDDLEKQRQAIELPQTMRRQTYRKFKSNKEGVSEVSGVAKDEPIKFWSIGGQNFPESNLNLRVFAKKIGSRAAYDSKNRIRANSDRVTRLEDIDIMDAEGNLITRSVNESEFRDRGFSSDFVRSDVQLQREETNRAIGRYLTSPKEFETTASGLLEKFLAQRTINPELYESFVSILVKTLQEDADRIVREGKSNFLTRGEKDRVTQRTVVGTIKNKPELFREISKQLQERFKQARKSNTEPNTFVFTNKDGSTSEIVIDSAFVNKAFDRLQKELTTIKEERLSSVEVRDRARRILEQTARGLEEGSMQVIPEPYGLWFEGEVMPEGALIEMLSGEVKEKKTKLSPSNYRTIQDIDFGERVGGKTKHSYTELKDMVLSGKLFSTKLFKERMKEVGLTELESLEKLGRDGSEFTVDPETGSLVESKPMSQEYLTNLDNWIKETKQKQNGFADTAITFIGEQFKTKLNALAETAGLDPELFVRWGLIELMKLKDQLTQTGTKYNEVALRLAGEEYTILSTVIEDMAAKNNIDLNGIDIYKDTLINSGFSGQVKKAVNPESIMYQIKTTIDANTPFGDIVQRFNNHDFISSWQILRALVETESVEDLLRVLPKSSLRNSITELEQMGLITLNTESEDQLIALLTSGANLQDVFSITENGLKVLQTTRHSVNQLGYFGATNLKDKVNKLLSKIAYEKQIEGTTLKDKMVGRYFREAVLDYRDKYLARLSESNRIGLSNSVNHLITLSVRKQLVEKQLQLLNQAEEKGLNIAGLISSGDYEKQQEGFYYLDLLRKNETSLKEELNDISMQINKLKPDTKPTEIKIEQKPKLELNKNIIEQTPQRISYKAWDGANDAMSLYEKIMQALDGNTSHYVGKWKNSARTALQDDMMAWAYGMNNQPQTKPSEFAPTLVESKRAQRYDGTGKPVFTSEDLSVPENAELSGMLSEDLGQIATKYASTRGARDSADLALRNRLKQQYGFDLPVGYGWTDFMDLMRDVIQKYKVNPPRRSDGTLDTASAEQMSEYMEALNQYVLQNTGREIPQKSMPSGVSKMLKRGRMLSLGMLGPSMGMSVAFTELPLVLARKNGSWNSLLKGLEVLGSSGADKDIRYTAIAYQKLKHGYAEKFGGDAIGNSERSYIKRMSYFFKKMFKPDESQLKNSGQSRTWAYIDNLLESKAALSMEVGGMSQFVDRVLSIAYEKEKMNLFNIKDKLEKWINLFDNEKFKTLSTLAEAGDANAQKELVKLFKQYSRESGVPIEVASYLWMAKLGNKEDIQRVIKIMSEASDTYGSFDMKLATKNVLDGQFGSAANKIYSQVETNTLSKLAYYLELSARGASPEPFGIGTPLFKWKGNELGKLITFLATYPIAAYQMYSIRNGTTHTAAAMIAVALGVMGMEIFAKRLRDVLSGKKNLNEIYDEYKNAPLAYFLRDMSYAQTGGILDQFINPFFQILGKSQLPKGMQTDPKDFYIATPQIGDLVGLQGFNDILKQTTQAFSALGKGNPSQLVDLAGRAVTTGTVGKMPADAAQALYGLVSKTKPAIWDSVIQKYNLTNPAHEMEFHKDLMESITKTLLETLGDDTIENPLTTNRYPKVEMPSVSRLNQINQPMVEKTMPSVIGTPPVRQSSKPTSSGSKLVTPNVINALMDSKGVSSLLVDELIRNSSK